MSDRKAKADVREVLENYSGAAARLEIDEYMTFFADDPVVHGVLELFGLTGPLVGTEAVRGFFAPAFEGQHATTSLGLLERAGGPSGESALVARYDDKLVLTDKGWKFKERRLTKYTFEQVANPKVS
jgi:ketosteroid isomerase-like protein